jgi:uncharacterized protein YbdZ (MbtH family)
MPPERTFRREASEREQLTLAARGRVEHMWAWLRHLLKSSGEGKHGPRGDATPAGWRFETGELGREDVQRLLAFHFEQMRSMSPRDSCHVLPVDGLRDPAISFWSLRDGPAPSYHRRA